jgi:hypothetical protein
MSVVTESVLDSEKKLLGLDADYDVFDDDLVIHINSIFGTLHQLGVGPDPQLTITDNTTTWGEYSTNSVEIMEVRTYVYLRLRLLFDPPSSGFVYSGIESQARELEWRLIVKADEVKGATGDE